MTVQATNYDGSKTYNLAEKTDLETVLAMGSAQCLYSDGNTLSVTVTISGVTLSTTTDLCFLTVQGVSGTPFQQVTVLAYTYSGNTLNIKVRGAGFVSGHILKVNYKIIREKA